VGPGGKVVHVDLDARVFGRNVPTALGVNADLGLFAQAVCEEVAREGLSHPRARLALRTARSVSPFDSPDAAADAALPVRPQRLLADVETALGERARFVTDIGEHMLFALHYITAGGPDAFHIQLNLGSMGSGIAGAIGLALAVFFFKTFRLSGILRALFLVPWLLPLLVSASTWSWMLNSDSGIVNSFLQAVGMQPIDWLTSPRWALVAVLIANIWIGIPFNLVIGPLVHANLDWTFGPFRYVIASPVFHRWHHVKDPAFRDKNFAPTFPVLDLMFGTFYMPKGVLPQGFGVDDAPRHFLGQMVYPFRAMLERVGQPGKAGQSVA